MKQFTAIFLAAALLLSLAACDGQAAPSGTTTLPPQTTQTVPSTAAPPATIQPTMPEPIAVSVTLDPNGGVCEPDTVTVYEGEGYASLPTPTMEGYVFLGWFTAAEAGEQITADTVVTDTAAHTLYAHWEVKTRFTVTLDPGEGRISPYNSQLELKKGDTYGDLPEPIREGYTFLGWYTQPEDGARIKSTTKFNQEQDAVIYAQWAYDAEAYWRFVLENTVQQIPLCRRVVVYLERNAGYKTYIDCPLLTEAGAINPAEGLEDYKVTDEWIHAAQPYIIVKLATDTDMALVAKTGMLRRFPDAEIYIFSTAAVTGAEEYQLYCQLYLAKLLYPEYFENVDLDTVKSELNVKPFVYYE